MSRRDLREEALIIRRALVSAALFSLVLAAPVSAATQTVAANDDNFSPSSKSIPLGDKVNWNNPAAGSHRHTSTSNASNPMSWNYNMPDGTGLSPSVTFAHVGSFGYHCEIHASMKGTVLVRMSAARIDSNSWTVRAGSAIAQAGFAHRVQFRKMGALAWTTLGGGTFTARTRRFDAPSAGSWQLRGRYEKGATVSGYSPILTLTTT
jgi:plastocyanin